MVDPCFVSRDSPERASGTRMSTTPPRTIPTERRRITMNEPDAEDRTDRVRAHTDPDVLSDLDAEMVARVRRLAADGPGPSPPGWRNWTGSLTSSGCWRSTRPSSRCPGWLSGHSRIDAGSRCPRWCSDSAATRDPGLVPADPGAAPARRAYARGDRRRAIRAQVSAGRLHRAAADRGPRPGGARGGPRHAVIALAGGSQGGGPRPKPGSGSGRLLPGDQGWPAAAVRGRR